MLCKGAWCEDFFYCIGKIGMIIMESQGFKIIKLATYNKRLNDEDKYGRIMTEKGELAIFLQMI